MTEAIDPSRSGIGPLGPAAPGEAQRTPAEAPQGVAFRALLEKLEAHAQELAARTDAVRAPDQLAGAVDRAKETLAEALGVGDQILEAYRQALQQRAGGSESR